MAYLSCSMPIRQLKASNCAASRLCNGNATGFGQMADLAEIGLFERFRQRQESTQFPFAVEQRCGDLVVQPQFLNNPFNGRLEEHIHQ